MSTIDEQLAWVVNPVQSHFLDSGSFTLWTKAAKWGAENKRSHWDFYDTQEFWDYMEAYATFLKDPDNARAIDLYANVDAIPNPELTFRNQRWLEKQGLNPVPVVHFKTDLKWLEKYIARGKHEVIALGGLVGSTSKDGCREWIDRAFEIVCNTPNRKPQVKIHGFGVTNFDLMRRYPWWSVDSTSWTKIAAFGGVLVPPYRKGDFDFTDQPYIIKMSMLSPEQSNEGRHFWTLRPAEQRDVLRWFKHIDAPLGTLIIPGEGTLSTFGMEQVNLIQAHRADGNEPIIEDMGVVTDVGPRRRANLIYFEMFRQTLPKYPWAWRSTRRRSLNVM